jgi:hypothetical protein
VRQHTRFIVDPHLSPTVKDRGHIFIEFVLVAPVILFISLYSLRLVQVLQAQQIATTLSREIATEVYRNCVDLTVLDMASTSTAAVDAAKTQAAIQSCLTSTKNKYTTLINDTLQPTSSQDFKLETHVYRYDIGSLAIDSSCSGTLKNTSDFDGSSVGSGLPPGMTQNQMCTRNRVVRVSIRFTLSPISNALLGASSSTEVSDETTI